MTITTRPLRQEVVHVPAPEGFDFEGDGMIVSDSDIACYCRPEHGNHILVGSEDPACDDHYWTDSDKEYDGNFTDQWKTQAMRYGQRVPTIYDKSSLGGFYHPPIHACALPYMSVSSMSCKRPINDELMSCRSEGTGADFDVSNNEQYL